METINNINKQIFYLGNRLTMNAAIIAPRKHIRVK